MSNFIKKFLYCVWLVQQVSHVNRTVTQQPTYADISVGDEMIAELTAPPFCSQNLLEIVLLKINCKHGNQRNRR